MRVGNSWSEGWDGAGLGLAGPILCAVKFEMKEMRAAEPHTKTLREPSEEDNSTRPSGKRL
jgi:hypothetical protein